MGAALSRLATRGRHANVLEHLLGFLGDLDLATSTEVIDSIRQYRSTGCRCGSRSAPAPPSRSARCRALGARQGYLPYPEALGLARSADTTGGGSTAIDAGQHLGGRYLQVDF